MRRLRHAQLCVRFKYSSTAVGRSPEPSRLRACPLQVLSQRFSKVQSERDDLYEKFEASIYDVQQKTGLKSALLERRLEAMQEALEMKEAQLAEVRGCARPFACVRQCAASFEGWRLRAPGAGMRVCVLGRCPPACLRAPSAPSRPRRARPHPPPFVPRRPPQVLTAANLDPGTLAAINKRLEEVLDNKNQIIKALQYDIAKVSKAHNDLIRVYEAKLTEFGIPVDELGFRPLVTNTSTGPAGLVVGA